MASLPALIAFVAELDRRDVMMFAAALLPEHRGRVLERLPADEAAAVADAVERTVPVDLARVSELTARLKSLAQALNDGT